jgi:putative SOS response-associated peptidase YedK
MCGRYTLFTAPEELAARFDVEPPAFEPSYNCSPGQSLPVITDERPDEFTEKRWGLTPSWADSDDGGHINARGETVAERRTFSEAFERRPCLVPADGFYEWVSEDGGRQPYRVAFEDDRPFAMAGIYERWTSSTTQTGLADFGGDGPDRTAEAVETFAVITTEPNELVADLHHRMAVVLPPDEEATWLHGDRSDRASLLDPHPADEMTAYPVSTRVNDPGNDEPSLVKPVDG